MRRCSACKKIGHTKRACISSKREVKELPKEVFFDESAEILEEPVEIIKKPENREKSIFVRVVKDSVTTSPHVLHVAEKTSRDFWKKLPIFQEKKDPNSLKRVSVDLAAVVRSANEQNKELNNKISAEKYFYSLPKFQKPFFSREKNYKKVETEKIEKEYNDDQNLEEEIKIQIQESNVIVPVSERPLSVSKNEKVAPLQILESVKNSSDFDEEEIDEENEDAEELFQDDSTPNKFTTFLISFSNRVFGSPRAALAAFIVFLVVALPYPVFAYYKQIQNTSASVLEASTNGFLALQSSTFAALHADIDGAQQNLNKALESFSRAESILDQEHQALQYIAGFLPVIGTEIESRRDILSAGHHVAIGNTYFLKGIQEVEADKDTALTDRFYRLREHFQYALPQYKQALSDLAAVSDTAIPGEFQKSFGDFKILFAAFVDDTQNMIEFVDTLEHVFGSDDFKRYLLVFQNNRELRPTGGFMGSFAVMDIQKGKILNLVVPPGGTYDLQGQLTERVKPPTPLLLTNDRWEFQDANWWPDFPASAQKMAWFYQHGRGSTVDGVIAVNATVFEKLLSIIGPLENEKHDVTLDSATALNALQYKVELDYDKKANTPKAIIGDVLNQLLVKLQRGDSSDALKILVAMHSSLQEKEIQAYFTDAKTQNELKAFGWSGEIVSTDDTQDYLLVVNTNIQGQKSDAKIKQEIEHQAEVLPDGTVMDTVVIRRTHTGSVGEMFYGKPNISYLRLYVPKGAILVQAGGFTPIAEKLFRVPEEYAKPDTDLLKYETEHVFEEKTGTEMYSSFKKTVFGNWVVTNPGETSEVFFTYKLPFKIDMKGTPEIAPEKWQSVFFSKDQKDTSRYSLVVQKQSGIESDFSSTVIYDKSWHPVWKSREDIDLALNGGLLKTLLKKDEVYGLVMEKE